MRSYPRRPWLGGLSRGCSLPWLSTRRLEVVVALSRKARIAAINCSKFWNTPRRIRLSVISRNHHSTKSGQELLVGMKCTWSRLPWPPRFGDPSGVNQARHLSIPGRGSKSSNRADASRAAPVRAVIEQPCETPRSSRLRAVRHDRHRSTGRGNPPGCSRSSRRREVARPLTGRMPSLA